MIEAHSKILLPLSRHLAAVVHRGVEVVIVLGKLPTEIASLFSYVFKKKQ